MSGENDINWLIINLLEVMNMLGIIFSIIAGLFIGLQNVFNARISEKIGTIETTVVVHGIGLAVAILAMLLWGDRNFKGLKELNKLYLLGGAIGVVVVFCVTKGVTLLGTTYAVAIQIITQLIVSTIIDTKGLFGAQRIQFNYTKPLGIVIMILGIIVFKSRG